MNNCKSEQTGEEGLVAVLQMWVFVAYQFWWVVESTMTAKRQNSGMTVWCIMETKINMMYVKN